MATVIHTEDLAVSFDGISPVFEKLDLAIEKGEFVTLVGVSGAGKSTLLRVIADLIPAFKGTVRVDTPEDSARRAIAMVFQAANLMPWRRVGDNITLGLEGIDVSETNSRRFDGDGGQPGGRARYGGGGPGNRVHLQQLLIPDKRSGGHVHGRRFRHA